MSTKYFEKSLDWYATKIKYIINDIQKDKESKVLERLESLKKDIEEERDEMQKDRWESMEYGSYDDDDDDDDDWEETTGIDPALGTYHD